MLVASLQTNKSAPDRCAWFPDTPFVSLLKLCITVVYLEIASGSYLACTIFTILITLDLCNT